MKSWDKVKSFIQNKEIDINNYVVLVPQKLYEQLIAEADKPVEENEIPFLYYDGLRIMWDAHIKEPLLVTKDLYNVKYNPCDFVKLL